MSKKLQALASGTLLVAAAHLLLEGPAARDLTEKVTALFVACRSPGRCARCARSASQGEESPAFASLRLPLGQGVADHGKEAAKVGAQGRPS
ncbi:MAG: hypothetical protein AB7O37_23275 [Vicinamibacteria bacterium]